MEAPKPAATGKRARRRGSVFVEAVEIDSSWVAPTYPHTAEELERLDGYVAKTILLSLLDTQAKKSVIGAFQKRTYQATEDIITQVPICVIKRTKAPCKRNKLLCIRVGSSPHCPPTSNPPFPPVLFFPFHPFPPSPSLLPFLLSSSLLHS